MLLIDAHVHLYDCFDLSNLLSAAERNFKCHVPEADSADTGYILLLAMRSDQELPAFFSTTAGKINEEQDVPNWHFHATAEPESIIAENDSGCKIIFIGGRQIVSVEGLEVLSLLSLKSYQEGKPVADLLTDIALDNGIAVLPWAFGKWFGKRGRIIKRLQEKTAARKFFFGDNGGRPWCIPQSSLLQKEHKQGNCIVSGSDPLPIRGEEMRVGSFGGKIMAAPDYSKPAEQLRTLLHRSETDLIPFGKASGVMGFSQNQCRLRGILS